MLSIQTKLHLIDDHKKSDDTRMKIALNLHTTTTLVTESAIRAFGLGYLDTLPQEKITKGRLICLEEYGGNERDTPG
jgi:hypothetical protein